MERILTLRGAQAGGADTLRVQDPVFQRHKNKSGRSVTRQDSAYSSNYGTAEDLRDPKDGLGTEHTDLPLLPDSAEHEQGEDDSLLEQSESCPRDGIGEKSQDPQNGSASKGPELPQVQDPAGHKWRDSIWESETRPRKAEAVVEIPEDALGLQNGSATKGTELPQVQDPAGNKWRDSIWKSEIRPRKGKAVVKVSEDAQDSQDGSATKGTELPQVQGPAGHRQGEAASLLEQSQSCPRDGIGEDSQDGSAMRQPQKKTFRGFLSNLFRSHPVLTLALLALLLLLVVVFGVSLAAVSGRTQTEIPVTPDTPQLLACPKGWVGYRGLCYFLSRDHRSWDQAQARCSELGASLAMPKDWEMEFVFRLSGNIDHWLGLRRRDQGLHWEDGSSFTSLVPVLGNAECVFLADDRLRSGSCSNEMPYLCSRPQTHLG